MKKRLQDFVKKSGGSVVEVSSIGNHRFEFDHDSLEQFAKLIVQDCAVELEANRVAVYDANKHHEYWNCGVKWAVAKIRDHISHKLKYIDCDAVK